MVINGIETPMVETSGPTLKYLPDALKKVPIRGPAVDALENRKESTELDTGAVREFKTGATRDTAQNKPDYEGFLSPLVIEAFGVYMHYNRLQSNGNVRDSDNWQLGIPQPVFMKSAFRHFVDWWKFHRGLPIKENLVWAICGILFNAMGYLHEAIKNDPAIIERARAQMEEVREKARQQALSRPA